MSDVEGKIGARNEGVQEAHVTITLEVLDAAAIDQRLAELLNSVQMPLEELRARAERYVLTPREQGVLDQIEDLVYLQDAA